MNHTSYTTRQSLHRDCLNVLITLIDWPGETGEHFEVKGGIDERRLSATRFNTYASKRARATTYDIPPDGKAHLFKSEWEGLYYAVTLDGYRQGYDCTCEQPGCIHVRQMAAISRSR